MRNRQRGWFGGLFLLLGGLVLAPSVIAEGGGVAQFSASTYPVDETEAQVVVRVNRTRGGAGDVTVDYSIVAGSANSNDFTGTSGTLAWADGDIGTKTFTVDIANDPDLEGDETIHLTLLNPTGGLVVGQLGPVSLEQFAQRWAKSHLLNHPQLDSKGLPPTAGFFVFPGTTPLTWPQVT